VPITAVNTGSGPGGLLVGALVVVVLGAATAAAVVLLRRRRAQARARDPCEILR
jgi:hypothetical protein